MTATTKLPFWEIIFISGARMRLRAEDADHAVERALAMSSRKIRAARSVLTVARVADE